MKIRKIAISLRVAEWLVFFAFIGIILLIVFIGFFPEQVTVIDHFISKEVQNIKGQGIQSLMAAISLVGDFPYTIILPILASLFYFFTRNRRETGYVLLIWVADLLNYALKKLIARPRPTAEVVNLLGHWESPSFPSGHVVHYTFFFGFILYSLFFIRHVPRVQKIFLAFICSTLILAISFSRIYLGAHWVSDVLGGYLTGFVFLSIAIYYYRKGIAKPVRESIAHA